MIDPQSTFSNLTVRGQPAAGPASAEARPLLICFSHLRWDFVWQRPQHLLSRAASEFDVIFVEEPLIQAVASPQMSLSRRPNGVRVAVPCIPAEFSHTQSMAAQRKLVLSLLRAQSRGPTVLWYYTPMAMAFSADLDRDITVYDNMDELSAFRGASPELLGLEQMLLQQADVVFTGGLSLYEAKRGCHSNLHAFPSSIDVDHFARARTTRMAKIGQGPSVRLGFFGVIDERLDTALVDGLAALRPDWQIDMVGPVAKIDPADLPRRPNINWLGPCPYNDLPDRLATWDVGIMPFALNEATRFISPTKTPEFLAAGLPVVSTPIIDVVRTYGQAGLVEIGGSPSDFVAAVERLLARPEQPWLDRVDQSLSKSSWTATWAAMRDLMTEAMQPRTATLSPAATTSRSWQGGASPKTRQPSVSVVERL